MKSSSHEVLPGVCSRLIAVYSSLVPSLRRQDWREEWLAELEWAWQRLHERPARPTAWEQAGLLRRCAGPFWDAWCLRRRARSGAGLQHELHTACRTALRRPILTAVSLLALALGLGASALLYGVARATVFAPLPYLEPERLVRIWSENLDEGGQQGYNSPLDLLDWRREVTSFDEIGGWTRAATTWMNGSKPQLVGAGLVSEGTLEMLGVHPMAGRLLALEEYDPNGEWTVLLSYSFWQSHFAGSRDVLGQTLLFDETPHEVVGVLPPGLPLLEGVAVVGALRIDPERWSRSLHWVPMMGRLRRGVSLEEAQADLDRVMLDLERRHPRSNRGWRAKLEPLSEVLLGTTRTGLLVLFGLAAALLLVSCAAVAHLLLASLSGRRADIAVRRVLGARPFGVFQQHLVEAVSLYLLGGLLGAVLAAELAGSLLDLVPVQLKVLAQFRIDAEVVGVTLALALGAGLAFGLPTAWRASRSDPMDALRRNSASKEGRLVGRELRVGLLAGQVALAFLLLVGAALMTRAFLELRRVEVGFETERAVSAGLTLPYERYGSPERIRGFYDRYLEALQGRPDIERAALINRPPLTGSSSCDAVRLASAPGESLPCAESRVVSPGYFAAAGIPLRAGRELAPTDDVEAPGVAVVNEAFVDRYLPQSDPLGQEFTAFGKQWAIVGVSGDVRHFGLKKPPYPEFYTSYRQTRMAFRYTTVFVRSSLGWREAAEVAQAEVRRLDEKVALSGVCPVAVRLAREFAGPRFQAGLLVAVSAVALVLALLGVGGVASEMAQVRAYEVGIRQTLGASRWQVWRLFLRPLARVVGLGLGLGLVAVLAAAPLAASFAGVGGANLEMLSLAAAVLVACALLATWLPVRWILRAAPAELLRSS